MHQRAAAHGTACEVTNAPKRSDRPRTPWRALVRRDRADAKAKNLKFGRKPKLPPHQRHEALRRKENGEALREIARSYNVHNSTISRLAP